MKSKLLPANYVSDKLHTQDLQNVRKAGITSLSSDDMSEAMVHLSA